MYSTYLCTYVYGCVTCVCMLYVQYIPMYVCVWLCNLCVHAVCRYVCVHAVCRYVCVHAVCRYVCVHAVCRYVCVHAVCTVHTYVRMCMAV